MIAKRTLFLMFLGIVLCYLMISQLTAIWAFTIDDMYITLRYAKNWVAGNGLLWNVAEPPVEGYSNFLFVCLAALAMKMGLNPVVTLKCLGALGLVMTSGALYALSRFWLSSWLSLIPAIWLLVYRDEILWATSGLETTIYQALLVSSVYVLLRAMGCVFFRAEPGADLIRVRDWFIVGGLFVLLGLTRPEGGVLAIVFFMMTYFVMPRVCRRYFYVALGIFALFYGTYFIWRWYYYGLLMPNSVYCKGFAKEHWLVLDKAYLRLVWPFLLFSGFAVFGKKMSDDRYDRRLAFLWVPSMVYLVFVAKADPVSAYAQRLFLPAFVLLFPLTIMGIQQVLNYFFMRRLDVLSVYTAVGAFGFVLFFLPITSLQRLAYFTENPYRGEQLRLQVIDWLNHTVLPEDHVVLADSGIVPYLVSAHFDDSYCLNNRRMAKDTYDVMFEQFCARTMKEKPAVIILSSLHKYGQTIYAPADQCLKNHLTNSADYKKRVVFQMVTQNENYRYEIFEYVTHSLEPYMDSTVIVKTPIMGFVE